MKAWEVCRRFCRASWTIPLARKYPLSLTMKLFAFTLDLEPEYGGSVGQQEIFRDLARIENLLSVLHSLDVKITAFTVGKLFEQFPEVIELLERYHCEFEAHSFSHDPAEPDSEFEIQKTKAAFFQYFQRNPIGYRAPEGRITHAGIELLEKHGFLYDSSIFPSYFPNPLRYLFSNRNIHYHGDSKIMEIPFTSITPFRLTLNIAYIKLLGLGFYKRLCQVFRLPEAICFNAHLHDFIVIEDSYRKLSPFWKFIYRRNKYCGIDYCVDFLQYMSTRGYRFCFMS
jgi:hypothetical protein